MKSHRVYWGALVSLQHEVLVTDAAHGHQPWVPLTIAPLDPRFDLAKHSPTGFAWGYGGSGPAQLALALCADALRDDERARRIYQRFKSLVAGIPSEDAWCISSNLVRRICDHLERERPSAEAAS